MWWSLWWVWMVGALLLAILEVMAPAQIFLGFAIGAAGVGAEVLRIYGDKYVAIASVILTLLILFISEIIPKTLAFCCLKETCGYYLVRIHIFNWKWNC